jgi:hypothetical protein
MVGILLRAGRLIFSFFTKYPGKMAGVAQRLGMKVAELSPAKLVELAKQNPYTTALIALEMGSAGHEVFKLMDELPPEEREKIKHISPPSDNFLDEDAKIGDLSRYADEMKIIKEASDIIGGTDRLLIVRKALQMDDKLYQLYFELRDMRF